MRVNRYKNPETKFNGIIYWLNRRGYYTEGTYNKFIERCADMVLEYARINSIPFKGQGKPSTKANRIARKIDFNSFANWVLKTHKK